MKDLPFALLKSAQPLLNSVPFFFCDRSKFDHKVIKIDKCIGICMENGLKMFEKVGNFFIFTPIVLQVQSRQVYRSRHKIYQLFKGPLFAVNWAIFQPKIAPKMLMRQKC